MEKFPKKQKIRYFDAEAFFDSLYAIKESKVRAGEMNLLVLEDDDEFRPLVERLFDRTYEKYSISWCSHVNAACELVAEAKKEGVAPYDLILSDLRVPDPDTGIAFWNFCAKLVPEVPFAFTSSVSEQQFNELVGSEIVASVPFLQKQLSLSAQEKVLLALID